MGGGGGVRHGELGPYGVYCMYVHHAFTALSSRRTKLDSGREVEMKTLVFNPTTSKRDAVKPITNTAEIGAKAIGLETIIDQPHRFFFPPTCVLS